MHVTFRYILNLSKASLVVLMELYAGFDGGKNRLADWLQQQQDGIQWDLMDVD